MLSFVEIETLLPEEMRAFGAVTGLAVLGEVLQREGRVAGRAALRGDRDAVARGDPGAGAVAGFTVAREVLEREG